MKIAFVVNDVMSKKAVYTTTRLVMAAVNMGHESYYLGVGNFIYAPDGSIQAHVRSADGGSYDSLQEYLAVVRPSLRLLSALGVVFPRMNEFHFLNHPFRQNCGHKIQ